MPASISSNFTAQRHSFPAATAPSSFASVTEAVAKRKAEHSANEEDQRSEVLEAVMAEVKEILTSAKEPKENI